MAKKIRPVSTVGVKAGTSKAAEVPETVLMAGAESQSDTPKKVGYKSPPAAPWKPGVSPNPGGKPVKSRNRLQGDFVRRLADDFERYGIYAIARCRRKDPAQYLRVIGALMPKELEIKRPLDDITDEQLDAAAATIRAILAAQGDRIDDSAEKEPQQAR